MNNVKKILIADDSQSSRDLLRIILLRSGCQVIEARDGAEALTQATNCQPDLFILDLNMPELDGYAVASELRKAPAFAKTPILALSAAVSEADTARLEQAGFSMFIAKPVSPAKIRAYIDELLDQM